MRYVVYIEMGAGTTTVKAYKTRFFARWKVRRLRKTFRYNIINYWEV